MHAAPSQTCTEWGVQRTAATWMLVCVPACVRVRVRVRVRVHVRVCVCGHICFCMFQYATRWRTQAYAVCTYTHTHSDTHALIMELAQLTTHRLLCCCPSFIDNTTPANSHTHTHTYTSTPTHKCNRLLHRCLCCGGWLPCGVAVQLRQLWDWGRGVRISLRVFGIISVTLCVYACVHAPWDWGRGVRVCWRAWLC